MINIHAFTTVTDKEISLLMANLKFQNFFRLLSQMYDRLNSKYVDFPSNWLISSIDRCASKGELRFPKEHGSHINSQALDLVPLTDNLLIRLPIPLNRNVMLMDLFSYFINKFPTPKDLPIIAFEPDHLHIDVLHPPGLVRLRSLKETLDHDAFMAKFDINANFADALDDKALINVSS